MDIDVNLSGYTTPAWSQVMRAMQNEDFAERVIVRHVLLPGGTERIRFRVIRLDGRPSQLAGLSLEQFLDATPSQLADLIFWTADTYLRGYATPLAPGKRAALGRLLRTTWDEWAPIVFSILPEGQTEMHVLEIIDDMARHLEGSIEDRDISDYLQYANLQEIREAVAAYFPDDRYPVVRT